MSDKDQKSKSTQKTPSDQTENKTTDSALELENVKQELEKAKQLLEKDAKEHTKTHQALEATKIQLENETNAHTETIATLQKNVGVYDELKKEHDAKVEECKKLEQSLAERKAQFEQLLETSSDRIKELEAAQGGVVSESNQTQSSLDDVLQYVSIEEVVERDGVIRTIKRAIKVDEVLGFKDNDSHVVVVTKSGQRIRGDK